MVVIHHLMVLRVLVVEEAALTQHSQVAMVVVVAVVVLLQLRVLVLKVVTAVLALSHLRITVAVVVVWGDRGVAHMVALALRMQLAELIYTILMAVVHLI